MRFDFSTVDDSRSFSTIEEGVYACKVAEVREGHSRDGSVRWSFRLEVVEGEYAGRTAAWDSITWSERGIFRVKRVLEAFGLDVQGELDIEPADLEGLQARVQVQPEEREDPFSGQRQVRMRVPFLGIAPLLNGHEEGLAVEGDAEISSLVDDWGGKAE